MYDTRLWQSRGTINLLPMRIHFLELIWYKTIAELRAEAARSYVGFLWWVIEPVMYMAAFYVIFKLGFKGGGENFVPFLLCGLVTWKWFNSSVSSSSRSIKANKGLMRQVYLPKFIFPIITVSINTIKFMIVFGLFICFLLLYGYTPTTLWLILPVLVFIQFVLILAFSSLAASLIPFIPDLRLILDNLLTLMFFLSGIFFDISKIPAELQSILKINPMAVMIESYRSVLLSGQMPETYYLTRVFLGSLAVISLAYWILNKFDRTYPKVLV